MNKIIPHLLLLISCLGGNMLASAQTIQRDVSAASGETLSNGDVSLTFVIGEAIGDLFSNVENAKYLSSGFIQPDIELREIFESNISKPLMVYPNPSRNGLVKLAFNNSPEGTYIIEIIDALGRVLQTKTVSYFKENFLYVDLDVSSFAKGIYFIRARNNSSNFQGQVKLIKI